MRCSRCSGRTLIGSLRNGALATLDLALGSSYSSREGELASRPVDTRCTSHVSGADAATRQAVLIDSVLEPRDVALVDVEHCLVFESISEIDERSIVARDHRRVLRLGLFDPGAPELRLASGEGRRELTRTAAAQPGEPRGPLRLPGIAGPVVASSSPLGSAYARAALRHP